MLNPYSALVLLVAGAFSVSSAAQQPTRLPSRTIDGSPFFWGEVRRLTDGVIDPGMLRADFNGDGLDDWFQGVSFGGVLCEIAFNLGYAEWDYANDFRLRRRVSGALASAGSDAGTPIAWDVDLDGDVDLVEITRQSPVDPIRVHLNDGIGSFALESPGRFPGALVGPNSQIVTSFAPSFHMDLDGDLDEDLLVMEQDIKVFLNRGDQTFEEALGSGLVPIPRTIGFPIVTDLNDDGLPDIFLSGPWDPDPFVVYHNVGGGRFIEVQRLPLGLLSAAYYDSRNNVADIDGDGDVDIAVATNDLAQLSSPSTLGLFVNDGSGRFSNESGLRLHFNMPNSYFGANLAFDDVDRDGDPDIIFAIGTLTKLMLNDGTGHFWETPQPRFLNGPDRGCLWFLDLDEDGDLDCYDSRPENIWWNLERHLMPMNEPRVGSVFELEMTAPAGSVGSWALSGTPGNTLIPGIGRLMLGGSLLAPAGGVNFTRAPEPVRIRVPNNAALRGLTIYMQSWTFEPATGFHLGAGFKRVIR